MTVSKFMYAWCLVSDVAIFVLKRDVKLQPTNPYAWCQLTQFDVPDCDGPGRVGLWTLTRICSISQTDVKLASSAQFQIDFTAMLQLACCLVLPI